MANGKIERRSPPRAPGGFLSYFIAMVVTVVWAASFVADLAVKGYDPPGAIHVAMLAVVGFFYGLPIAFGERK